MKNIFFILLCLVMFFTNCIPVSAYEYPSYFWSADTKYIRALERNDYIDIITYGLETINIANSLEGEKNTAMIVNRYAQVASAYAELGDYQNSLYYYKVLYDYVLPYGNLYYDFKKVAKSRILQYEDEITMYTDQGNYTYFGAKNEKRNGVLFGLCSGGKTRSELSNESMVLTYQELDKELLAYNVGVMSKASAGGYAVEFALNCSNEGKDIENIMSLTPYLKEISDMFKEYSDVPVYLRFAAEFDVWTVQTTPEKFIPAFRYVSNYFKKRNPNVAVVWSVNQASSWYVDINDYYPGDEYVDWVGISLYTQKYFLGDKNESRMNEVAFKTGINSDPVLAIKDIVETYGNRKPVMIVASGCSHTMVETGENTTDFAVQRLKEHYSYIPMVYPQVKLIAYFDHYIENSSAKNDYRLSSNNTLKKEYLKLTKGQRFIQDDYGNDVDLCYRPVVDGTVVNSIFPVSCYAHRYGTLLKEVTYFIDGKYVDMSVELPFTAYIDAEKYSGHHKLKAIALFDDGQTMTTESEIYVKDTNNISVEIGGDKIHFDQEPVLYNNRTMVPMRKIFEELGAKVTWNNSTRTATGKKGDRTVKITVGQNKMYVNNKEVLLDTAPIVVSGRTLVPVRAVAEGLGCDVKWNNKTALVSITPKIFRWSSWDEDVPDDVEEDLYYIESKKEYKYRTKKYFETSYGSTSAYNYVKTETSYGAWSEWQNNEIVPVKDRLQVETRTVLRPKSYHYIHWCTGNLSDSSKRYRTASYKWCDEATYHDLGWFDNPLPCSEDSTSDYVYMVDGKKYRCSNTCYRWYLKETSGGDYIQYRSREIIKTHTFWEWSDWSEYGAYNPYDDYGYSEVDVESRTVYRYKEK